jgi:hypothetical protein
MLGAFLALLEREYKVKPCPVFNAKLARGEHQPRFGACDASR